METTTIIKEKRVWTPEEKTAYNKEYYRNNMKSQKERVKVWKRARRLSDPLYLKIELIRNHSRISLGGYKNGSKIHNILGISYQEFRKHIEKQFESWMTWDNHFIYNGELNYGWQLDHIIPLSSAKNEEELIKLSHYTNLQPICGYTNMHLKDKKHGYVKLKNK